jgi:branched-chain amino acid aminotransferase
MAIYYVDGNFVPAEEAFLPVSDLIILRGYGVFDFLRTYRGKPFHLEAHIRRLQNSARLIGLSCPWSLAELKDLVTRTLQQNDGPEFTIRLLISGGDSDDSITPGEKPRLLIMVTPLKTFPDAWYRDGVKITTTNVMRSIPGAKSIDYIRGILALNDAQRVGAIESVYVDDQERVLEGTTSNIFAVINGELVTPPDNILPGVTRDVTLAIAKPIARTQLRSVARQELYQADEVFLSSSNKEILPVSQVDGKMIANGQPGVMTKRIMELFSTYTEKFAQEK